MTQNLVHQKQYFSQNVINSENPEGGLNLGEVKNIIFRKWLLIAGCTLTFASFGFLKASTTSPSYSSSFEILSEPLNIETKVTSTNYNDKSTETREEITSVELDDVQLKILKSPKLITRVVKSLQDKHPEISYQDLSRDLDIEIINNKSKQNILQVAYSNPQPQKVSDVIDRLARVYVDYSAEKRQTGIRRGIDFLDKQIPKASLEARKIEEQIRELRTTHRFLDPNVAIEQITNRSNNLNQELELNIIKLQELKLNSENLKQELSTPAISSTTAIELGTPRYLALSNRLRDVDLEISRKSVIYRNNSVEIQGLQQEKKEITALLIKEKGAINQKLNNQIGILENRQKNIASKIDDLQSQLEQWSIISSNYDYLQEQLAVANNKLNEFTLQKDALLIDAAQQEAPWQLLTPATEPKINNISTVNYIVLGSTLGLLLGIGLALFVDKHQDIIYSIAKVEEVTNLPVLGMIPHTRKSKKLSPAKQITLEPQAGELATTGSNLVELGKLHFQLLPTSIEAFRSLAANLGLLNFNPNTDVAVDPGIKSIIITSATPQEGKSTVALNLARSCAAMGKKVLLVDTDLRSVDCLSKNLNLESAIGLSQILSQNADDLGLDCIRQLPLENNLFVIASGLNCPDGDNTKDRSHLLASAKMHLLMKELENHFDLIIYDICAITGFADVNLLASQSDGILVVAGLGKVQTTTFIEALDRLKLCKIPILGVALNQVVN